MASFHSSQEKAALVSAPAAGEPCTIRVVIAMPSKLERMAWGMIVDSQPDMQLIAQAASCDKALAVLKANRSDVTLIDEALLDARQCEALREYSKQPLSSRFVLVAPYQLDDSLDESRYSFTHTYLLKGVSATELLETIRTTANETGS
jgi:DNA-binding NarL/FixJ family response regulator